MYRKNEGKTKQSEEESVQKNYNQDDVNNALEQVRNGMSTRDAAIKYKVPRSTLYAKHKNIIPVQGAKGPATYLITVEEKKVVNWILYSNDRGFPVTKSQLLCFVQKLVTELGGKTPFKDNQPGRHWYESFCHRHKQITTRVSQNLSISRAKLTECVLREFEPCASNSLQFSDLNIDVNGNDTNIIILERKEDINCLENIDLDMMIHFAEGDQDIEIESTENITESVPELVKESIVIESIDNVSENFSANVDISILENSTRSVTIIENAIDESKCQIIDLSIKKTNLNISSTNIIRQILGDMSNESAIKTNIMSPFDKVLTCPDNLLNKEREKAKVVSTVMI